MATEAKRNEEQRLCADCGCELILPEVCDNCQQEYCESCYADHNCGDED